MASIAGALARIKEDLQAYVPDQQVLDACRDAGMSGGNASSVSARQTNALQQSAFRPYQHNSDLFVVSSLFECTLACVIIFAFVKAQIKTSLHSKGGTNAD